MVLATSLLQNALEEFGAFNVGFLGKPFIKDLLYGYPINIHPYDKSLKNSLDIIKQIKHYDAVLSLHVSLRSALVLYMSGIKKKIGFDRSEGKFLYTDLVHYEKTSVHEIYRNIKLLEKLISKSIVPKAPKLYIEKEIVEQAKHKLNLPDRFLVISPTSNFFLKTWKQEYFLELSKSIDIPIVILSDKVLHAFNNIENVYNLSGKTSLKEFLAILSLSELVIANDSSAIHISNAFGKKAMSIYCATSSIYGFYPLQGSYLEPHLDCHPCSINPKRCKTKAYACLDYIKPTDVLRVLEKNHLLFS